MAGLSCVGVDSEGESLPDMDVEDDLELGNVQFDDPHYIPLQLSDEEEDEASQDRAQQQDASTAAPAPPHMPVHSQAVVTGATMPQHNMQQGATPVEASTSHRPSLPANGAAQRPYTSTAGRPPPGSKQLRLSSAGSGPDNRILLLFDLNGVLTDHTKPIRPFQKRDHVIRPHIEELLMLMPHFRVGVYSSATLKTVNTAIDKIVRGLRRQRPGVDLPHPLFEIVLTRDHCAPDTKWQARPRGNHWDTCKPLAKHGFELSTTVLIDNDHYKAAAGEEDNMLLVPDWLADAASDEDFPLLVKLLLLHLKDASDVRPRLQQISRLLVEMRLAKHGPGAQPANMPSLLGLPHMGTSTHPPGLPPGVDSATEDAVAAAEMPWGDVAGQTAAHAAGVSDAGAVPGAAWHGSNAPQLVVDMRMLGPQSAVRVVDFRHLTRTSSELELDSRHRPAAAGHADLPAMHTSLPPAQRAAMLAAAAAVWTAEQQLRSASIMQLQQHVQQVYLHSKGLAEAGSSAFAVVQYALQASQFFLETMAADGRLVQVAGRYQLAVPPPSPSAVQEALFGRDSEHAAQLLLLEALYELTSGPGVSYEEVQLAVQSLPGVAAALLQGDELARALHAACTCSPQRVMCNSTSVHGPAGGGIDVYRCCAVPDHAELLAALQACGSSSVASQLPAGQVQSAARAPYHLHLTSGPAAMMPSTSAAAMPLHSDTAHLAGQPAAPLWLSTSAAAASAPYGSSAYQPSWLPCPGSTAAAALPSVSGQAALYAAIHPATQAMAGAAQHNVPSTFQHRNGAAEYAEGLPARSKRPRMGSVAGTGYADEYLDQLYVQDEMRGHMGQGAGVDLGFTWQDEADDVEEALRALVSNKQMQPLQMAGTPVFDPTPTNGQRPLYPPTAPGAAASSRAGSRRANAGLASGSSPLQQQPEPLSALHHEVAAFARRCAPTQEEAAAVKMAVQSIDSCVRELWPNADTVLFGSQASGLALPGSDLDIVILNLDLELARPAEGFERQEKRVAEEMLRQLKSALVQRRLISGKHQILGKKVPIIKAELTQLATGSICIPVDISVGASNGAAAVGYLCRQVDALPQLRPLVLLAKALLKERGLNEVFMGGLSSYSLVNMVIAHLQCERLEAAPQHAADGVSFKQLMDHEALGTYLASLAGRHLGDMDLGHLAAGFFERFGNVFDYTTEAVSVQRGGVVPKPRAWIQLNRPHLVAVEDPQQQNKDIGSGSHNIKEVKAVYQEAAAFLQHAVGMRHAAATERGGQLADSLPILSEFLNIEAALGRGVAGVSARKAVEHSLKAERSIRQQQQQVARKADKKASKRMGKAMLGAHGTSVVTRQSRRQQQQQQYPQYQQHLQYLQQSPPFGLQMPGLPAQPRQQRHGAGGRGYVPPAKGNKKGKQRAGNPALHQVFGGVHKKAHGAGGMVGAVSSDRSSTGSGRNAGRGGKGQKGKGGKHGNGKGGGGKGGGGRGWSHED